MPSPVTQLNLVMVIPWQKWWRDGSMLVMSEFIRMMWGPWRSLCQYVKKVFHWLLFRYCIFHQKKKRRNEKKTNARCFRLHGWGPWRSLCQYVKKVFHWLLFKYCIFHQKKEGMRKRLNARCFRLHGSYLLPPSHILSHFGRFFPSQNGCQRGHFNVKSDTFYVKME